MAWISRAWNLLRSWRVDRDVAEELQFHLDSRIRQNIAFGMERDEAERDARRRFGNQTLALENAREADILVPLQNIVQDVRFATRLMYRRPLFAGMAVLLLGLGIGVTTATFSLLLRAVFPRNAFENSARLVFLWRFDKRQDRFLERFSYPLSYSDLSAIRHESHRLKEMSIYRFDEFNVNVSGKPESIHGFEIEPSWLRALGVPPLMGRNISRGDRNVAILTHELWQRLFHADANVLGQTLRIDNRPFTIIAVLPAGLDFDDAEIFVPLVPDSDSPQLGRVAYYALANVQNGFSLQQARAEVGAIVPGRDDWLIHLATLKEKITSECGPTCGQKRKGIWLLFATAFLVMLLACANVANLLLGRATGRRHEFLVRAAIGCSRFRLIRQILTESAVLFVCGGALAVILAFWLTNALARFAAAYVDVGPATGNFLLDPRALLFTALATLITAALFGAVPAVRSASGLHKYGIREAPKIDSVPLLRSRARGLLVASEFALSVVLLAGLGLLLRSFLAVESIPVGINTERLLTVSTNLAKKYGGLGKRITFAHGLLEKIRGLPAVSSAALTSSLPLTGAEDTYIRIEGIASPPVEVRYISVSPNFFETMQLPIIAGRPFSEHDSSGAAYVIVINQTLVRALFPNGDAIGHRVQMDESPPVWREIVGIAADVRQRNLEEDSRPVFYRPYGQGLDYDLSLAVRVRSKADMSQTARSLQNTLLKASPELAWQPVQSMRQVIYDSESLSLRRPIVRLLGAFGLLALLLTSVGMFAVLSYSVVARTREIGIRMAVGARQIQVVQQIVAEMLWFTLPGACIGTMSAYILSQLLPSGHIGWSGSGIFLYGISRFDVLTYLSVFVLLCFISIAAAFFPARRAIHIDPSAALREE
jgi:putative ABC transport system permease protein